MNRMNFVLIAHVPVCMWVERTWSAVHVSVVDKARQTEFAVYHHSPHGFSDFQISDCIL